MNKKRRPTLDELAAAIPHERCGGTSRKKTQEEQEAMVNAKKAKEEYADNLEKHNKGQEMDWEEEEPVALVQAVGEIAEKNPANLNRRWVRYVNRNQYTDQEKAILKTLGMDTWNEHDKKVEEEVEKKYADKPWVDWS